MVARTYTVAFQGIDVIPIDVEVHLSSGLPAFNIVGLANKAVVESRERIRSCFHAIGLSLPAKRITVNLAPADIQKEGSHFDLAIAMGLMVSMNVLDAETLLQYIVTGELSLDGRLNAVPGILPTAIKAVERQQGIICPDACGSEAAWAGDLDIVAAPHLLAIINHFKGTQVLSRPEPKIDADKSLYKDLKDVKGQEQAKRALTIAAAGRHHLLMIGPPGVGKSMLASRLPAILPDMTPQESLEVTTIHSVSGTTPLKGLIKERPFRSPHYTASLVALVGGGHQAKPGELSLAHHGVLFLDELPEFARGALESLRQPLETQDVSIARANLHVTYPAQIQLVAAMNPCRCGHFGNSAKQCHRVPQCAEDYQNKISGPIMDRFDLVVHLSTLKPSELSTMTTTVTTNDVMPNIQRCHDIQKARFPDSKKVMYNALLDGENLDKVAYIDHETKDFLTKATEKFHISARGYNRILRVARTIADLDQSENVQFKHVAEALRYRTQNTKHA